MNPQPQAPVQPAPTTVNPQGVMAPAPNAPATPTTLPQGPTVGPPMAPPQNPNYDPTAAMEDIRNYYNIPREAALTVGQAQAQGTQAGQEYGRTEAQTELQLQNAQNSLDKSKYTVTQDPQGEYGLSIVGPLGQKVSFADYVNLTGSNPAEVLQQSTDPGAQQFVSAYNNLENFMQTVLQASGGSEQAKIALGDYYKSNPGLESMTPKQVTDAFMSQYGQFLGQPQSNQSLPQGITPTFQSAQNPINQSPYYEISAYGLPSTGTPESAALLGGQNPAGGGSASNSPAANSISQQLQSMISQQQQQAMGY